MLPLEWYCLHISGRWCFSRQSRFQFVSHPAFYMMYSEKVKTGWQYTALSYSFPNFEPVRCSMCTSNCHFLTCIQVSQETGNVLWYSHPFENYPVCCDPHSQRLWHSQWIRSRCCSGILLLFLWSNRCASLEFFECTMHHPAMEPLDTVFLLPGKLLSIPLQLQASS